MAILVVQLKWTKYNVTIVYHSTCLHMPERGKIAELSCISYLIDTRNTIMYLNVSNNKYSYPPFYPFLKSWLVLHEIIGTSAS